MVAVESLRRVGVLGLGLELGLDSELAVGVDVGLVLAGTFNGERHAVIRAGVLDRTLDAGLCRLVDDRSRDLDVQLPVVADQVEGVVLVAAHGVADADVAGFRVPVVAGRALGQDRTAGVDTHGVVTNDDRAAAVATEHAGLEREALDVGGAAVAEHLFLGENLTAGPASRGAGAAGVLADHRVDGAMDGHGAVGGVTGASSPLRDLGHVAPVRGDVHEATVVHDVRAELRGTRDPFTDRATDVVDVDLAVRADRLVEHEVVDEVQLVAVRAVDATVTGAEVAVVAATVIAVEADRTAADVGAVLGRDVAVAALEVILRLVVAVEVLLRRLADLDGGADGRQELYLGLGRDVDGDVLAVDRGAVDADAVGLKLGHDLCGDLGGLRIGQVGLGGETQVALDCVLQARRQLGCLGREVGCIERLQRWEGFVVVRVRDACCGDRARADDGGGCQYACQPFRTASVTVLGVTHAHLQFCVMNITFR